jgi:hypothetical protein
MYNGAVVSVVERKLVGRVRFSGVSDSQSLSPSLTDFTTVISDFNKTTKQKIGPPAATVTSDFKRNHGSGAPAEPSACLFHNPHAKESASTSLDHPCT